MKPIICAFFVSAVFFAQPDAVAANTAEDTTYVIPIKGMIERGLVYAVKRGIKEAKERGAGAIILDMDTPGGKLGSCEEIVNLLLDTPVTTYTFVNPRAISAGAIIAFATDKIYMTPSALIGDAMPILMSPLPFGSPQEPGEGLKEKIMSPTVALIRAAAQQKGHDTNLAEAMVRPEFEYKIGEDVISPAGNLVTLTSLDAERKVGKDQHPLLSSGTVKTLDDLLKTIGRSDSTLVIIEITPAERIARLIEGFPLSGILLALGLLGLYVEFKTPGFGFPGIAGILLLAIWFWGHNVAGVAGIGELILFIFGIVLLLIEIFLIPGFGYVGVTGIVCIGTAIAMGMVEHLPSGPLFRFPEGRMDISILNIAIAVIGVFTGGILLAKLLPKTHMFQTIMLGKQLSHESGFQAAPDTTGMIGMHGTALTPLRPAGTGEIDGKRVNVVARGEFIDKDKSIVVAEVHGNRIVVEIADNSSSKI
ncbi:MAG: nodulation protein NfeD [Lentisphaerae bacterium]|nr:nodulation protein NfeD [Lentisphaerota bacterium]